MTIVKVGKRGTLILPSRERRKAGIKEGDQVDVISEDVALIIMRQVLSLRGSDNVEGAPPPWEELEGLADELLSGEFSP
jgi:AbrB family looped-hinge helix DNA binding protein